MIFQIQVSNFFKLYYFAFCIQKVETHRLARAVRACESQLSFHPPPVLQHSARVSFLLPMANFPFFPSHDGGELGAACEVRELGGRVKTLHDFDEQFCRQQDQ